MIRKAIALSFVLLATSGCMGEIRSFEYSMARRYGASMKLNLHVVDDEGNAVSNAQVRCSMSMLSGDWNRDSGLTDADGRACIEGTTDGHEIRLSVAKDGYYCSERKICFGGMVKPREVRFNRWQPYGEKITITLYPIRNPAKVVRIYKTISFPKIGERCGLDLDRGDWVAPHGKGVSADVWLCARWDVNPSRPARYIEADVGFSGDAGYYWEKPNESSSLRYPYAALTNEIYRQTMTIYRRKTDSGFDEWLGEENKAAVIRCRCVQADDGRIASCNYARVYGVNLFVNENGTRNACVFLNYIFNSTPNDTNLEYAIR